MIASWTTIGKPTVLAEGFGKQLVQQQFRNHRGEEVDFFFAEAPSWSVVLPITTKGTVVLVRQFKQAAEVIVEELPAGTAEFATELPEDIMRRELLEETGYEPGTVIALGSGWMNSRNAHTRYFCFLALDCRKVGTPSPDANEDLEVVERPLNVWLHRALTGDLIGWDACMTALRALPHLKQRFTDVQQLLEKPPDP